VVAYDEVEDVLNRHGGHVAELRHACVNGRDVVGACCRGVVLETETRLEAAGKELVRNEGTCDWVQEKDFCPCSCTTGRRAGSDFRKHHPVKRLEHGFRGFAVAGEPDEPHVGILRLLVVKQCVPFNNREHDEPHVGRPEFLDEGFTKEQKVPGVFDGLACGDNGKQRGDFEQLGAECGGHGKSCAEGCRHGRRCDLPGSTDGNVAGCCSSSSVVCLRDFVLVCVLATASHGVGASASGDENTTVAGAVVLTWSDEAGRGMVMRVVGLGLHPCLVGFSQG